MIALLTLDIKIHIQYMYIVVKYNTTYMYDL